jgi:predicted short-subunit dehydrogenase-like oxidoreductase (DUF2520 family)
MKIVFIGAGNLATGLSTEMHRAGMTISEIYSRTAEHAESLARKLNAKPVSNLNDIRNDADLYIFALTDDALPDVLASIKPNAGLWVHTAGCLPIDIFNRRADRCGVFYPLQTFSKTRKCHLEGVPIFIEANNPDDLKMLRKVAIALSGNAREIEYSKRIYLHLAAVFASNFTNHLYATAADILQQQGISYEILLPLITETADKIRDLNPAQAQTGPAVRFDRKVMDKHLSMLDSPQAQSIYKLVSQSIYSDSIKRQQ